MRDDNYGRYTHDIGQAAINNGRVAVLLCIYIENNKNNTY